MVYFPTLTMNKNQPDNVGQILYIIPQILCDIGLYLLWVGMLSGKLVGKYAKLSHWNPSSAIECRDTLAEPKILHDKSFVKTYQIYIYNINKKSKNL